jgi:hypothetical protein
MLETANSFWARRFVTICGFAIILPAVSACSIHNTEDADEGGKRRTVDGQLNRLVEHRGGGVGIDNLLSLPAAD